jgi:hypothetical protein
VVEVPRRTDDGPLHGAGYLTSLIFIVVLTQRFALPLGAGQVPLVVPLLCAAIGWGILRGYLRWDRPRVLLGMGCAVLLTALAGVAAGRGYPVSPLSLAFIFAIYVVAVAVPHRIGPEAVTAALRSFSSLMTFWAVVGVGLFAGQYVGLPYRDYFTDVVPEAFVQQGYVTAYPIEYLSPIYRSNGVVFLEASFYSLFLALGLLVTIYLGRSVLASGVLACAMIVTLSGNGMVVLIPGIVALLLDPHHRRRLARLVVPVVLAVLLAANTPLGATFVSRTTEVQYGNSSTSLRLVQPYQRLIPPATGTVDDLLLGHGPGSADVYYQENLPAEETIGLLTPFLPKVLYEYGALGVLLITFFLVQVIFDGTRRRRPWLIGLLLVYFFVNAALLQPTLAYITILFLGLLRPTDDLAPEQPVPDLGGRTAGPTPAPPALVRVHA